MLALRVVVVFVDVHPLRYVPVRIVLAALKNVRRQIQTYAFLDQSLRFG